MTRVIKVVIVLACASVVWAMQSTPPQLNAEMQKSIEKAVLETHAKMMEAEKALDAEEFFKYILDFDNGMIIQDGTMFKTRQEALDIVQMGFEGVSAIDRTYDRTYVTVLSPQTAVLTAKGTSSVTLQTGQMVHGPFAVSMVFVQRDGRWRLLHGHYSTPNPQ
jgi:uncharacterized protein (TIGR02246 family)